MTMNSIIIPKCMSAGCLNPPTHAPVLCVPRKGIPLEKQQPIKACLDIPLCMKHISEPTVREMLTPAMQALFTMQTKITNSNPPDFDKAWLERTRMDGKMYLDALRQKKRKGLL